MADRVTEQPPPQPNDRPAVWPLVIADMQARDAEGIRKYGTPLQTHSGRDALVDAYQEALDLAVYLRQCIEERSEAIAKLEGIRDALPEPGFAYTRRRLDEIVRDLRGAPAPTT